MKGIIYSASGLLIGCIACFFVFALQGLFNWAVGLGILSLLGLFIRAIVIHAQTKPTAFYSPSRSRRVKNRKLQVRAAH